MGAAARIIGLSLLWGLIYSALLALPIPRTIDWLLAPWTAGLIVGLISSNMLEAVTAPIAGGIGWNLLYLTAAMEAGRLPSIAAKMGVAAYLPLIAAPLTALAASTGARLLKES